MDLSNHFESLWTGLTQPNKFRGRPCTLLKNEPKLIFVRLLVIYNNKFSLHFVKVDFFITDGTI